MTTSIPSLGLRADEIPVRRLIAPRTHTHSDVELNFIRTGSITYLMSGRVFALSPGRLYAFWAGMPHWIMATAPRTRLLWATAPLAWVLRWRLPGNFMRRLLDGALFVEPEPAEVMPDLGLLSRWAADLRKADPSLVQIIALELEARLRRFAHAQSDVAVHPRAAERSQDPKHDRIFSEIVARIEARSLEDVPIVSLLDQIGISADYAGRLFRSRCGLAPLEYRTRLRIAHAQRLLISTDRSITEIAFESGFGSLNRFYVAFQRVCGATPRKYRRSLAV